MGIKSKQEKAFGIAAHIVMIILSVLAVIPFWLLVASSFMEESCSYEKRLSVLADGVLTGCISIYFCRVWADWTGIRDYHTCHSHRNHTCDCHGDDVCIWTDPERCSGGKSYFYSDTDYHAVFRRNRTYLLCLQQCAACKKYDLGTGAAEPLNEWIYGHPCKKLF